MDRRQRSRAPWRAAILLALLVILGGLLAACGGDDATSTAAPTSTSAAATSPAATSEPATEEPATEEPATEEPAEPTATSEPAAATATTVAPTATATGSAETLTLAVYFIRDEKVALAHRTVPHTQQVAAAAMQALLAGPTPDEQAAGMSSSVPAGTRYLGVAIGDDKVATVNLSGEYESGGGSFSMAARLAQVVYTLTQFPTIEKVTFSLDGQPVEVFGGEGIVMDHPVGRAAYEEWTPAIFVDTVAIGDHVSSPLRLAGTANVFEAVFFAEVRAADGSVAAKEMVTATSGTGTRGTYDVTLTFDLPPGPATVVVYADSPKDGSAINVVEIPVMVAE